MKKIAVITGGGSGMGLSAAKCLPKDKTIVVSGRTVSKLERAIAELKEAGYEAYAHACDTSDRASVKALAEYAASLGTITNAINAAGVSPHMSKPEPLLRINALGTVYFNQEFSKVMDKGSAIVDIASNSAYALPSFMVPKSVFPLCETDEELFVKKIIGKAWMVKDEVRKSGMVYAMSKTFVVWYAKKSAIDLGKKGIRVCSLSPGLIATDMGEMEKEDGAYLIDLTCEKRMGTSEELGYAIATVADERNGFLAGVDVLVDGGATTHQKEFKGLS